MGEIKPVAWLVGNDNVGPYALRHTDPKGWKHSEGLMKISDHEAEVARLRAELEKVRGYEVAPLEAKVAELLAEVEMLRKDAERYRWLRDTPWFDNYEIRSVIAHQQNALWDKTIDAAMGASA